MKFVELAHIRLEEDNSNTIARRRTVTVNGDFEDVTDISEMMLYDDLIRKENNK